MTACMIGLALGQLVAGPISDWTGRRRPLLTGLALYAGSSLLCAWAGSIEALVGLRFVPGFAAAIAIVLSRAIVRDRSAEFRATGSVAELAHRAERARRQLRADIAAIDPFGPPRGSPRAMDSTLPLARTQGGALLHIYEELPQHRGQLEITRDVLRRLS